MTHGGAETAASMTGTPAPQNVFVLQQDSSPPALHSTVIVNDIDTVIVNESDTPLHVTPRMGTEATKHAAYVAPTYADF